MVEEIDLFEHYETLPKQVQDIISSWDEMAEHGKHSESERIIRALEPFGYTCDYGLCCEPHSLRKIGECEIGDWAFIKDWIVQDEGVSSNYGMVMSFSEHSIPNCQETNWYVHMTLKNGESVTVNAHEIKKLY